MANKNFNHKKEPNNTDLNHTKEPYLNTEISFNTEPNLNKETNLNTEINPNTEINLNADHNSSEAINPDNLTFGQLLSMVDSCEKLSRLPKALSLRESKTEILFRAGYGEAQITIYRNGLILYERDGHSTVSSVDRCASPSFIFSASVEESTCGGGVAGCIGHIRKDSLGAILISNVPESELSDMPWFMPISYVCETRLDDDREAREKFHSKVSIDSMDGDSNLPEEMIAPDVLDKFVEQDNQTAREKLVEKLHDAFSVLTDMQYEVIQLYYYQNCKQEEIAKKLGISQPMVHKHLEAAYAKLKKELLK